MTNICNFITGDGNAAPAFRRALAALDKDRTISFPEGEYHFYPEGCAQKYCYFSNNDEGIKTIAMLIENIDGLTISGDNARFIFHGRLSPLAAYHCRDLTVRGVSVDFEDSFVSDADLVKRENGKAWFRIGGKYRFSDGKLHFTEDFYDNLHGKLHFRAMENGLVSFHTPAVTLDNRALEEQDGLVAFPDEFADFPVDTFVIKHELRLCPGMVFDHCRNLNLERVIIHHAAGMGILAQQCDSVALDRVEVIPSFRRVAASDDAVHMTECRGTLRLANCNLTGTLDDSLNVHGVYHPMRLREPGMRFFYLDSGHFQQMGLPGAEDGDTLELIKNDTHRPYGTIHVKRAEMLTKAITRIDFDEAELPAEFTPGDCVRVMEVANATLEVVNCKLKSANGRGVLASGMKKVHIHGNDFCSFGSGIHIAGGANYWFETGPVGEVVIENNRFENCCVGSVHGATREPVIIFPELDIMPEDFFYHGSITVRNNHFVSDRRTLVAMRSVTNATVTGNSVEFSTPGGVRVIPGKKGYFFTRGDDGRAAFWHCGKIVCDWEYSADYE